MFERYHAFAARKQRVNRNPTFWLADENVAQMDNGIFWLDRVLPVADKDISEVFGTVTVRGDFGVIEVGIAH